MRMVELKKKLVKNPHHIENILKKYQFHNISVGSKEIRCGIDEDTNRSSIRIRLDENLSASDYGRDIHGDIFILIMRTRKVDLKDIILVVKNELGLSHIEFRQNKKIFGGFYERIKVRSKAPVELKTYDEALLKNYSNKYNVMFLKDGITFDTQRKFKIGLCHFNSRITVPWFNYEGELVGIEGRYTGDYKSDEVPKWFPIIAFPKSQVLFGYYTNYEHLHGSNDIYVGESSKFCMQLDSMGIRNSVALGGNSIHREQIKQLSWLNAKRIIFCFDEGLDIDVIDRQVNKVKDMLKFFEVKIGFILDKRNLILKKGTKHSPSDLGYEAFNELIKNHIEWR